MNPWYGSGLFILGLIVTIVIRSPYENRGGKIKVEKDYKGTKESLLLAIVFLGLMVVPILAIFTPLLTFADYPLYPAAFAAGCVCLILNVWLFRRSHLDLGTNWSRTLELREGHKLITNGVYKNIRHPMYTAIFLFVFAQMLLIPNWIAGPAGVLAFSLLFFFRVKGEERMMLEKFGDEYLSYMKRTKRLIPFVY